MSISSPAIGMRCAPPLALALPLFIALVLACPREAFAGPYVHYMAQEMSPEKGDWTSEHAIKRMYWHPATSSGLGATVQAESSSWPKHWSWFPLRHVGNGYFYGERWSRRAGRTFHETVYVYHFEPTGVTTQKIVYDSYAIAPFAWVRYAVGHDEPGEGWVVRWRDSQNVILKMHDSGGWQVK